MNRINKLTFQHIHVLSPSTNKPYINMYIKNKPYEYIFLYFSMYLNKSTLKQTAFTFISHL